MSELDDLEETLMFQERRAENARDAAYLRRGRQKLKSIRERKAMKERASNARADAIFARVKAEIAAGKP
jgi:hypothetical protein